MRKLLLTLIFSSALYAQPGIDLTEDLNVYDENNDGIALFNLTDNSIALLDGLDPEKHTISYHLTFNDADANSKAIANTVGFTNTVPKEQELYARVTSIEDPSEYSVDLFFIRALATSRVTQESASKAIKSFAE